MRASGSPLPPPYLHEYRYVLPRLTVMPSSDARRASVRRYAAGRSDPTTPTSPVRVKSPADAAAYEAEPPSTSVSVRPPTCMVSSVMVPQTVSMHAVRGGV